jgi:hypothetical protein
MGKLEKLIIQFVPHKPLSWFRFIDDVDMKWTESEENLNRFFDHVNKLHPTIKFTHETSRNNISFLDTYTTCKHGIVMTNDTLLFVFFSVNTTCFAKTIVNARIVVAPLFQMTFQLPKPFFGGLLSSHTILRSVIYPASFVSTGQPYKNTQNCVKSLKNHPSWPSGNPKV